MEKKEEKVIAISGIKNSGKTTLITKLIPYLKNKGYKVATIKHDGHDFDCDIEGTDTYKHIDSGAEATAIFSKNKYMIINKKQKETENIFIQHFSDMDIIILEGFKSSKYPKIEVIRKGISSEPVCNLDTVLAVATDLNLKNKNINKININDIESIGNLIINYIGRKEYVR